MLASEIIYNIKNLKSGGTTSDDNQMSDYQWLYIIDNYRAQLIKQQQSKGQSINEACVQKLVPSKIVLTQDTIQRHIMYTQSLPKAVEGLRANFYTYIGTEAGKSYQRTTYQKAQWDSHSKYVACLPKWYEIGDIIYVSHHHPKNLKLAVHGVFESPMKVLEFNGQLNQMNPFDFEYPMSSTMVDTVIKMIADSEMKLSLLLPKDSLNDGRDGE